MNISEQPQHLCFLQAFEKVPDLYLILSPELVILTASDAYLKATCTVREEIAGERLFDVIPDKPMAWAANAVQQLRHSLQQVLTTRQPHRMSVQRADVPNTARPGSFEKKYWLPSNTPVLDEQGQVQYIIHKVEDVTENISNENKLVRGFRHLNDAQAIGHIGSFERLLTENVISCSNEWYRLHGLEPQSELITLNRMYTFFHPEDRQATLEAIQHTLTTGEPLHLVGRIIRADGAVRYMQRRAEILKDEQGQPYKVYGTLQDVTEQVEALKKAEAREALLRATEELANLGSYELDIATLSVGFSDGMYRLFGEEPQAFVPSQDFIDERSHPDDVPVVKTILEQAIHDKLPYHYTRRIRRADGTWRTLEAQGRVECDDAGQARKLLGLVQDVTGRVKAEQELKQSRELLKTTINSSLDMIQVFEAVRSESGEIIDFKWILNNRASEEIYGDVVGKNLLEHNPGVAGVGIFDTFKQVVETGIPDQTERHYVHEQFDGWFYQSTVKLGDGVATTTRDITSRIKAEQDLRTTKESLQAAQEQLQLVLANTASSIMLLNPVWDATGHICDFEYLYTNDQLLKSVSRTSLLGKRLAEEFPGVKQTEFFQHYVQVATEDGTWSGETHINFDGFDVWSQVYATRVKNNLLVTYFDITERKKDELELLQSKNLLQGIINAPNVGMAVYKAVRDNEGNILDFVHEFINKRTLELLGGHDLTGTLLSDYGEAGSQQLARFAQVLATGQPGSYVIQRELLGTNHWILISNARLDPERLVHVWEDITEQKEKEQELLRLKDEIAQRATDKYYTIFNSIDEGFCIQELIYDENDKLVDLRVVEANPAYERQTGFKKEDIIGRLHSELGLATESYWFEAYDRIAKTGKAETLENWHEPTDHWYHASLSRIGGAGSRLLAVVFNDITARKRQELRQKFLLKLIDTIRPLIDPAEIMARVSELVGRHYNVGRCGYAEVPPPYDHLVVERDWTNGVMQSLQGRHPFSGFGEEIIRQYRTGKTIVVEDVFEDVRNEGKEEGIKAAGNIRSGIAVQLIKGGNWVASFYVQDTVRRSWTQDEVDLMEEIAERTWAALERAKAEKALSESEAKYRTLFDSMDEGYCIIRMLYDNAGKAIDFLYLQVNQAFERNNGLHEAEGKTIRELAPDIEPKWIEIYNHVAQTGIPLRFEEDSEALHRIFSLYAFRIGDPAEHKVAVIFTDITERKKNQEALRQSEEQFRLFVTAGSDIIYKMNADWSRMQMLTGKDFLTDTREPIDSWVDVYIPTVDRTLVKATIEKAIRAKKNFQLQHQVNRADGTIGWVSSHAIPVMDEQGNIREWLGTASDITLRKQAEQKLQELNESLEQQVAERAQELTESKRLLQTVFDTTQIQISILQAVRDEQGNILDFRIELVNKELERETRRSDLIGKLYAAEYPGIKSAGLYDVMLQVMETGQPKGLEYFYPHEGFNKWYSCMFVRLQDGLIATITDITERKQAEEENLNLNLRQQKELLIAILEAQEEERRRISESLHNGVAQILYAAKLRVEGLAQKVPAEYVEKLDKLLQDAIQETRMASHELVPNVLKEFGLEQAILEMCGRFEDSNIRLEYEVEPLQTKLDSYQELALYRISQELINNVIKHSNATEAKLLLYQEDELIHLKVRDNGIGFKKKKSKHIGIGLPSIENTVKLLNGTLNFSIPSSGSGTQVSITMPIEMK